MAKLNQLSNFKLLTRIGEKWTEQQTKYINKIIHFLPTTYVHSDLQTKRTLTNLPLWTYMSLELHNLAALCFQPQLPQEGSSS